MKRCVGATTTICWLCLRLGSGEKFFASSKPTSFTHSKRNHLRGFLIACLGRWWRRAYFRSRSFLKKANHPRAPPFALPRLRDEATILISRRNFADFRGFLHIFAANDIREEGRMWRKMIECEFFAVTGMQPSIPSHADYERERIKFTEPTWSNETLKHFWGTQKSINFL